MLGVFLDIETSGLDPFRHEPLEIALVIVDLLSGKELAQYDSLLRVTHDEWERSDPSSLAINKISLDMLQAGKEKAAVAKDIEALCIQFSITNERAFFVCQNPSFDRPFFSKILSQDRQTLLDLPYHWLDFASMYFVKKTVFDQVRSAFAQKISKDSIAKALSLPPEQRPHRAMNGVRHLLLCYSHLIGFPG